MKNFKFYMVVLLAALSFSLISCDDDDETGTINPDNVGDGTTTFKVTVVDGSIEETYELLGVATISENTAAGFTTLTLSANKISSDGTGSFSVSIQILDAAVGVEDIGSPDNTLIVTRVNEAFTANEGTVTISRMDERVQASFDEITVINSDESETIILKDAEINLLVNGNASF